MTTAKMEAALKMERILNQVKDLEKELVKLIKENNNLKTELQTIEKNQNLTLPVKINLATALIEEEVILKGEEHPLYQHIVENLYNEVAPSLPTYNGEKAVLLVAKDISGSMGEWESFMSRCVTNWTKEILSKAYNENVEVCYVTFTTEAHEVNEKDFHHAQKSGGTIVSSGLNKMNEISERYRYEDKDDLFVLILSDGDNLTSDNPRCQRMLNRLSGKALQVWYVEMNVYNRYSTLRTMIESNKKDLDMKHSMLKDRNQLHQTIVDMFEDL